MRTDFSVQSRDLKLYSCWRKATCSWQRLTKSTRNREECECYQVDVPSDSVCTIPRPQSCQRFRHPQTSWTLSCTTAAEKSTRKLYLCRGTDGIRSRCTETVSGSSCTHLTCKWIRSTRWGACGFACHWGSLIRQRIEWQTIRKGRRRLAWSRCHLSRSFPLTVHPPSMLAQRHPVATYQ